MSLRSIRKRCESALRHIEVPAPFVIEEFCQEISRRRHRPLHLLPKMTRLGPCGVWLALAEGDYIFYESDTSQLHREHIILHELDTCYAITDPLRSSTARSSPSCCPPWTPRLFDASLDGRRTARSRSRRPRSWPRWFGSVSRAPSPSLWSEPAIAATSEPARTT